MNLVKKNLESYLPALVGLIEDQKFPWDRINQKFSNKINQRVSDADGEEITIEASIFDIIVEVKKGNVSANGLINYANKVFEQLADYSTKSEKKLITGMVAKMLTNLDHKYLNFFGELSVLNNLLSSGDYRLLKVEEPFPNGKSVDFKIRHRDTEELLFEIMNIHFDEDKVESDFLTIRKFLETKIWNKIKDKAKGLDSWPAFHIIPVLWGGVKGLRKYQEFFKSNSLDFGQYVHEPVSYVTYSNDHGLFKHYFGSISTLFDREQEP